MEKVLITGSSGLIGKELDSFLTLQNYEVRKLSRKKEIDTKNIYNWDIEKGTIDLRAIEGIDHIIHLAGANIGERRWSNKRKAEIINSRVQSTQLLYTLVDKVKTRPKSIISASAVGYYGAMTSDKIFVETDKYGDDFLGSTCNLWENEVLKFESLGVRTVRLRFGVVLSSKGGALKKMLLPAKYGLGSGLGTGKQFLPWVHFQDVLNAIQLSLSLENVKEVFNVSAPEYTTYNEFSRTLSKVLERPYFMPNIPAWILKLIFGEMSEIILEGSRVSAQKLINSGFTFKYTSLQNALENLLST